jgi:hypothetical protein
MRSPRQAQYWGFGPFWPDAYLDANLELKEKILAKTTPFNVRPGRYQLDDRVLAFLKSL